MDAAERVAKNLCLLIYGTKEHVSTVAKIIRAEYAELVGAAEQVLGTRGQDEQHILALRRALRKEGGDK